MNYPTFRELATQTDKVSAHGYDRCYDHHFHALRDRPLSLLEIGVDQGGSLRLWEKYFPHAKICGLDIDVRCLQHASDRSQVIIGDQADQETLQRVVQAAGPFDIVIDDGGHCMDQVLFSLSFLWPYMRPNGLYVIEDLGTSYHSEWGGNMKNQHTVTAALAEMVNQLHWPTKAVQVTGNRGKYSIAQVGNVSLPRPVAIHFYREICFLEVPGI